jgi:hypothetical protein
MHIRRPVPLEAGPYIRDFVCKVLHAPHIFFLVFCSHLELSTKPVDPMWAKPFLYYWTIWWGHRHAAGHAHTTTFPKLYFVSNSAITSSSESVYTPSPRTISVIFPSYDVETRHLRTCLSGIHPGYSCKEGGRVEDGLLLEFPCTPTRTRSV